MIVQLSLNMWTKRRNLATLNVLYSIHDTAVLEDLNTVKMMLFRVSQIWGGIMVINVAEIKVTVNLCGCPWQKNSYCAISNTTTTNYISM